MEERTPPPTALVFGEALIDEYPDRRVVAGAPLHVAVHLAERGWHVGLLSRIGRDTDGFLIRRLLEERGVDTSLLQEDERLSTGTVKVDLGGSEHHFTIERPAAWDEVKPPEALPDHQVLVYTGLALRSRPGRRTLSDLLERSPAALRCFDLTLRPGNVHPEGIASGLAGATLLKGNREELEALPRIGIPSDTAQLFDAHPHLDMICMTTGEDGALLLHRNGARWTMPAPQVEVVDTVGAGDAFTAALVDGLVAGLSETEALEAATHSAAGIVARRGGLPGRR